MKIYTDRSRIETYQHCCRKRYYNYEYLLRGVTPATLSIPMHVGSSVHKGVEVLLLNCMLQQQAGVEIRLNQELLDNSLIQSLSYYDSECQSKSFRNDDDDPSYSESFAYQENRSLVEALVRVYFYTRLSDLIERYEILAVEEEIEWELTDTINFLSRPDAILKDKQSDRILVYSLKTAQTYTQKNEDQHLVDVQGLSEFVAAQSYLQQKGIEGYVYAVKMDFLLKGSYMKARSDSNVCMKGQKNYSNGLIHPYVRQTGGLGEFEVSEMEYFYEWEDEQGNTKRLGKGWNRVNIWELGDQTLAQWIDYLYRDNIRNPLYKHIKSPVEIYRNQEELEEFLESVAWQEDSIKESVSGILRSDVVYGLTVNESFPKYRHSCTSWGSKCEYWQLCHEGLTVENAMESGLYILREPNHPKELENFEV